MTRVAILVRAACHVVVEGSLSSHQIERLTSSLTIANPEKGRAIKEHVRGSHLLPDTIELWRSTKDGFLLPRGIGDELDDILSVDIQWTDERVSVPILTHDWKSPTLRPAQEISVHAMCAREQGVLQAPPGFGKTVTLLEAIRRIKERALVIVDKTLIAEQWRTRAFDHLGLEKDQVGLIGDNEWTEHDLTIATQQTLWSRRDTLDDWWGTWGLVCLDECHHVSAETFYDIIQRFPAKYRIGLSATPKKNVGRERLVRAAIGPMINVVEEKMQGEVYIRETEFSFRFFPTHQAFKDKETGKLTCEYAKSGCQKTGKIHRNNYAEYVAALINDEARNDLIANDIVAAYAEGRAILVISRRHGQIDNIARRVIAMIDSDDVYRLSGKEDTPERMATQERADAGKIVIFSTIADEALDIPRLDTLVLPFPTKSEGLIEQQIGRIARNHPEKLTQMVLDYRDLTGVSRSQCKARAHVYRKKGLIIKAR